MAILATSKPLANYEPIPAGNYPGRCYSMVHLGTIEENILGVLKKLNKVRISWELPTELKVFKEENGAVPQTISKEFTLSLHEKATLRGFLKNWRGKDFTAEEALSFDVEKLIGAPCLLNITHKTKKDGSGIYAEIGSVSTMPKGFPCPEQITPTFIFTYENFDMDKFEVLPDFLKDKMKTSEEYLANFMPATPTPASTTPTETEEEHDDLPF